LWGEVNGVGQNKLGVLLMEVRAELLAAQDKSRRKAEVRGPSTAPKAVDSVPRSRRRAAVDAVSA
jgi:hypothetical protein